MVTEDWFSNLLAFMFILMYFSYQHNKIKSSFEFKKKSNCDQWRLPKDILKQRLINDLYKQRPDEDLYNNTENTEPTFIKTIIYSS